MSRIIATTDLVSFLANLREATEIQDPQGKVLGLFVPKNAAYQDHQNTLFDLDEAEQTLKREYNAGRPLRDIWSKLQGKGASG